MKSQKSQKLIIFHSQACKRSSLRNVDLCSTSMFTSPPWQTIALCSKLTIHYKLRMFDLVVQIRCSSIGGATSILFKSTGMQFLECRRLVRVIARPAPSFRPLAWLGLAWPVILHTAILPSNGISLNTDILFPRLPDTSPKSVCLMNFFCNRAR